MTDKEIKPEVDSQAQKKKRQAEKYRAREAESERWKQSDRDRETWIAVDKLMTEKEKQGRETEQAERVLPPPAPPISTEITARFSWKGPWVLLCRPLLCPWGN